MSWWYPPPATERPFLRLSGLPPNKGTSNPNNHNNHYPNNHSHIHSHNNHRHNHNHNHNRNNRNNQSHCYHKNCMNAKRRSGRQKTREGRG